MALGLILGYCLAVLFIAWQGAFYLGGRSFGAWHPAEAPFANRSTYAQCVEMGPAGPTRIESLFPLGQSGEILASQSGQPLFDDRYFAFEELFEGFEHRPFPLFGAGR